MWSVGAKQHQSHRPISRPKLTGRSALLIPGFVQINLEQRWAIMILNDFQHLEKEFDLATVYWNRLDLTTTIQS